MTKTNITPTQNKSPDFIAYHLKDGNNKKYQTRIGVAWKHHDEKGFSIHLDAMPIDGKIQLRNLPEKSI